MPCVVDDIVAPVRQILILGASVRAPGGPWCGTAVISKP